MELNLATHSLHLSHGERSAHEVRRVRGFSLSRDRTPLTPTLSPIRAFTPVFDGLRGRGSALPLRSDIASIVDVEGTQ